MSKKGKRAKKINGIEPQKLKAPVSEIFASYQGEGIYAGQPQIFIRFVGCNLRCDYCDTAENQSLDENQKYYSLETIVARVRELSAKKVSGAGGGFPGTVSLTGGEPLMYPHFLSRLLPEIKKIGLKVYLETNGTLPDAYSKVKRWIDVVSMDFKLPSSSKGEYWKEHEAFLKDARDKAFVKIVLTDKTADGEIIKAVKIVEKTAPKTPLVLQPATPVKGAQSAAPHKIHDWFRIAREKLADTSVLVQLQRFWGVK